VTLAKFQALRIKALCEPAQKIEHLQYSALQGLDGLVAQVYSTENGTKLSILRSEKLVKLNS
jgi:hypothetical protein